MSLLMFHTHLCLLLIPMTNPQLFYWNSSQFALSAIQDPETFLISPVTCKHRLAACVTKPYQQQEPHTATKIMLPSLCLGWPLTSLQGAGGKAAVVVWSQTMKKKSLSRTWSSLCFFNTSSIWSVAYIASFALHAGSCYVIHLSWLIAMTRRHFFLTASLVTGSETMHVGQGILLVTFYSMIWDMGSPCPFWSQT